MTDNKHPGFEPQQIDELPESIPVFPLSGVLLLPHTQLPLNIFEPRYRQMVEHALAGDRVIGMVQPREPFTPDPEPEIYPCGCLGWISQHRKTADGRYLINLDGICRFEIIRELERTTLYRITQVSYDTFAPDLQTDFDEDFIDRKALYQLLGSFLKRQNLSANWGALDTLSGARLINNLAMYCPFEPNENQALLEAETVEERHQLMMSLLTMALAEGPGSSGAVQ